MSIEPSMFWLLRWAILPLSDLSGCSWDVAGSALGSRSVRGALVGALMVGIFDTLSRVLIPLVVQTNATSALVGMAVYVLMAVVLLFSRTGLFAAHRG